MRLAIGMRNPAPYDHFVRSKNSELASYFDTKYLEHVRYKFPKIGLRMAERLSRALTHQRMYLRYRRDHHDKSTSGLDDNDEDTKSHSRGCITLGTTEPSLLPDEHATTESRGSRNIADYPESETTATSYASTNNGKSGLKMPSIPADHEKGTILCSYCYIPLIVNNSHQWK